MAYQWRLGLRGASGAIGVSSAAVSPCSATTLASAAARSGDSRSLSCGSTVYSSSGLPPLRMLAPARPMYLARDQRPNQNGTPQNGTPQNDQRGRWVSLTLTGARWTVTSLRAALTCPTQAPRDRTADAPARNRPRRARGT